MLELIDIIGMKQNIHLLGNIDIISQHVIRYESEFSVKLSIKNENGNC